MTGIQAQSKKELAATLSRDLEAYRQYTLAGDFDNSFNFMPPTMFDIIPRDSLIALMRQSMDNEYMKIDMTGFDFKAKQKYKIKKAGEYYWSLVSYDGGMRMTLKGDPDYKELLVTMMKQQFGKDNVQEEGENGLMIALKNKQLIAVKDPARLSWSLLEDKRNSKDEENEMQKMIMETCIPEVVRKAMGN
jgi:hypothetical protein